MSGSAVFTRFIQESDPAKAETLLSEVLNEASTLIRVRLGDRIEYLPSSLKSLVSPSEVSTQAQTRLKSLLRAARVTKGGSLTQLSEQAADEVWSTTARKFFGKRSVVEARLRAAINSCKGIDIYNRPDGVEVIGFTAHRDRPLIFAGGKMDELKANPSMFLSSMGKTNFVQMVDGILDAVGGPTSFAFVANSIATKEAGTQAETAGTPVAKDMKADVLAMWAAVENLHESVRLPFLKCPQSPSLINQFLIAGVSPDQIAKALNAKPADFDKVYSAIPASPDAVAKELGITAVQVGLAREMARKQLAQAREKYLANGGNK